MKRLPLKYKKMEVCNSCLSWDSIDLDCICMHEKEYPTIVLEFEECKCCHKLEQTYAETEFNEKQLKELE